MTQYYIGTSGWNYTDWRPKFYPKGLAQKNWLTYYAEHFNALEINATFYRFFKDDVYLKWFEQVPKDFHFILKIPKLVSHYKKLLNVDETILEFEKSSTLLKNKLGLLLLQLPPNMPYSLERLDHALQTFQHPEKVAVEFRNSQWITDEASQVLKKYKSIFCIPDSPDMELHFCRTAKIAYIRLHGKKAWFNYNYTTKDLNALAKFIEKLIESGANEVYVLFNNDHHAYAPQNAKALKKMLGA